MGAFQQLLETMIALEERDRVTEFPNSLGIPRAHMPQIADEHVPEFLTWLRRQRVGIEKETIMVSSLKPTQRELNQTKVNGMLRASDGVLGLPILVASDNYILDGHHRWIALTTRDPAYRLQVWRIGLPIRELLTKAKMFHHTEYANAA